MNVEAALILHMRLLAGDPAATLECIQQWLPILIDKLSARFPQIATRDEHLLVDAATDALFNYTRSPTKYQPERSSLSTYLFMAARRDLLNALRRESKQRREAIPLSDVEFALSTGNKSIEEEVIDKVEVLTLLKSVLSAVTDRVDQRLLHLMLSGERSTERFARELGISDLPASEQRRIVKRNKDRIIKRLERIGESLRGL